MAKARPSKKSISNLKPFKPGVSGNPLGGKLHQPELRAIKRLTAIEVAELGALILQNNLDALRRIAKDPDSSVLKVMIAAVAVKTIEKGDAGALNVILDRMVGKIPTEVKLSGGDGGPIPFADMTEHQLDARMKEITTRLGILEPDDEITIIDK